jgi:hypothetical protein
MQLLRTLGSAPFSSIIAAGITKLFGSIRDKEKFGLLNRPQYAYGMLRAADGAALAGLNQVSICEFGVAAGAGLLNMCNLADILSKETGIQFNIYGFDTGSGIPVIDSYKDHPELWIEGDFPMQDPAILQKKIDGKATLILGDIEQTIQDFSRTLSPQSPIGFMAIDVDIYSGTKSAFRIFDHPDPQVFLPAISMYFDDIAMFYANSWCGELAAIQEFNQEKILRKIDKDYSLPGDRAMRNSLFYKHMYIAHILDHPFRNNKMGRKSMTIHEHAAFMRFTRQ